MSQSTPEYAEDRVMLCQHAGELSEFEALLTALAVPFEVRTGPLPRPADLEGVRLVVVSGKRLLESGTPNLSIWPRTIAVIDDSSRTLVTHLSRVGAALVIRRPIHPRTLRLLLLHEIYRGPERRRRQRILIGHPIRVRSGLFRTPATLLELSPSGARIALTNAPKMGTKIRILLGKDLTKGKPTKLQAKVIRSIRSANDQARTEAEIGVAILDANRHAKVIKGILDRFALGPAPWNAKTRVSDSGVGTMTAPDESTSSSTTARVLPPSHASIATSPTAEEVLETIGASAEPDAEENEASTETEHPFVSTTESTGEVENVEEIPEPPDSSSHDEEATEPKDRRRETRIPYDKRVVALGEEAARVLVGRDLSRGGMRIAATPSISVGDVLRVALHSGTQTEPTVVIANALRDDGDDGLVLTFDDLSKAQSEQLEKIISSSLPVHASADEPEGPGTATDSIVVAEMIETISSQESVESEEEIDAHLDSVFDASESVEDAR